MRAWLTVSVLTCLLLAGCATAPPGPARPVLQLAPASLGATVSVQQRLTVERGGRTDHLEAALEIDAQQLTLVGLALGQRVLSIQYDGRALQSWRHPLLPAQVRAEDVLSDLQLTLWPAEALNAALPAGWKVHDQATQRSLTDGDTVVATVSYSGSPRWSGTVVLNNLRYLYQLTIESAASP